MALDYDTLRTTVGDYLDRSDLDSVLPTFIELAEAKLKRKLRHWKMEKKATADTVAGQRTLALPSDFLEMRHQFRIGYMIHLNRLLFFRHIQYLL